MNRRKWVRGKNRKRKLSKSIIWVMTAVIMIGGLQILGETAMLQRYIGQNRRAESNIVTAYLQNIEVSYSHLYQEMQQAVYDSETFARVDPDSDIYTYNRSIMAVKEYFQQLGISYGTDLNFFYFQPETGQVAEYGVLEKQIRENLIRQMTEGLVQGDGRMRSNGRWQLYENNYLYIVAKGKLGYVVCYMDASEFAKNLEYIFPDRRSSVVFYDESRQIRYPKASEESVTFRQDEWHKMNNMDFEIAVQPENTMVLDQMGVQVIFAISSAVLLVSLIFIVQYIRKNILNQIKTFSEKIFEFKEQIIWQEENGIEEFAETEKVLNRLVGEIRNLKIDIYEKQLEKQQTELDYAQLQIRPHFYINCLNVINSLAQIGKDDQIVKITLCVSKYLRFIFKKSMESIYLAAEIQFIKDYLNVVSSVEGMDCSLVLEIEEGMEQFSVPPLILQTFVENSIKYGTDIEKGLDLWITARKTDTYGEIFIDDNGEGVAETIREQWNQGNFHQEKYSYHIGIPNAAKRLHLLYGRKAELIFDRSPRGGCRVIVRIPLAEEETTGENTIGG
jgi:two-component system sensor histidine kinase YesM